LEFLWLSICGFEEFTGVEQARLRQLVARDHRLYVDDVNRAAGWSSDGSFQYSDIGRMTPADLPKVQAAVQRLREAVNQPKS